MSEISTYHLSDNPALYEPAVSNAFEFYAPVELTKLLPAGLSEATATDADYLTGIQDVIKLSVAEASVPHFEIDPIEVRRGNSVMKFAGTPTFSEGSIKLNDYVGARTKDVLMAWRNLVYDVENDVINTADKYKFDCKLVEYSRDFSKVLRTWVLVGCWPRNISEGNFSHDSVDKRQIDLTIVYDRAIPEIG